jgi:epoxide hydrolase-like predicted phosphatase
VSAQPPAALVVDWGGVLTTGVPEALAAWARSEDLDVDTLRAAFGRWLGPQADMELANPIHLLERGELAPAEVEQMLAPLLRTTSGTPVPGAGLLSRMFAHFTHAPAMTALVWRARQAGIATALLSNSWGDHYPEHLWDGTFDQVVISGRVGMRKPDPEIFLHTADLLGVPPTACVFVDDVAHNVAAAVAVGMVGVLHTDYPTTAGELSVLFGRDLVGQPDVR